MEAGKNQVGEPHYPFISEDADAVLEIVFEHPNGVTIRQLAGLLGLKECDFLIEELRLAGIVLREEIRQGRRYVLAPLRFPTDEAPTSKSPGDPL